MKKLIAGNWKMFGHGGEAMGFIEEVRTKLGGAAPKADLLICPPATLVERFVRYVKELPIAIGGQDCHVKPNGAFTGDIAANMLSEIGATYCIVGHSERREYHKEDHATVKAKAQAAIDAGLIPVICIGETLHERADGKTLDVLKAAIKGSLPDSDKIVVAYEPVWAIGSGMTPSREEIAEAHHALRRMTVPGVRLLYGGSVKPQNAKEILSIPDVDGALVGGASLKAADFLAIVEACP
ncbi:triose-phosphate isomerase [Lacibacterium aquatile]|uniref:Triosephosphate isomerase n=1 Tax=Lacibacterium aquatile TaxID=1168082 RepID=A0ABW5DPZ4_9PROT